MERGTDMGGTVDVELHERSYLSAAESTSAGCTGSAGPVVALYDSCSIGTISICLSESSSTGTSSLTVPLELEVQMVGWMACSTSHSSTCNSRQISRSSSEYDDDLVPFSEAVMFAGVLQVEGTGQRFVYIHV